MLWSKKLLTYSDGIYWYRIARSKTIVTSIPTTI